MLIEHIAPTSASDTYTLTEGRITWFFLGIDMEKGATTLSASVHAFLLHRAHGISLCCRMSGVISLLFVPLWNKSTIFF